MLWACMQFHSLSLEVFERGDASPKPLMIASDGNRPRIIVANRVAIRQGIQTGMEAAAALALCPDITVKVRDKILEAQALQGIAIWAEQFTPTRSIADTGAVLLEIGGCIGYFGGLAVLLSRLKAGINDLGYYPIIATAPTATGAMLLARSSNDIAITELVTMQRTLRKISLRALNYLPRSIEALEATGARTIGDCLALPRDGVARRYGQALLDIIGRAMGDIPDPQKLFISPELYSGKLELPAPVWDAEAMLFGVKRLTQEMCGWLAGRYCGVTRLKLDLVHEAVAPTSLVLNVSKPTRTADDLLLLWRERVSREKFPDRVEVIVLSTVEIMPLDSRSLSLLQGDHGDENDANLLDRLRARLGEAAVLTLQAQADYRPERAWTNEVAGKLANQSPDAPRPIWFLTEPQCLERGGEAWILVDGPERIEAGWWDAGDVCRDYYIARNPEGQTVWIYRDWRREGQWFLHGFFA